jgi:hypothetical protein
MPTVFLSNDAVSASDGRASILDTLASETGCALRTDRGHPVGVLSTTDILQAHAADGRKE